MLRTTFTELVGVEAPIQMSGMGSVGGPELAAAVSQAGGLGTNTVAGLTADEVVARADLIRTHTRHFARRQLTWFRHLPACRPVAADAPDVGERVLRAWDLR